MLNAELTLVRALEVLQRQEQNKRFRAIITDLADTVKSGSTLSHGLARYPRVFDNLYVNMVRAGEAGGILHEVFSRLAAFLENNMRTRARVRTAMFYPLVVIAVAALIVGSLMVFVIPRFETIYDDLLHGAALPPLTQAVIDVSLFVKSWWWLVIGALMVAPLLYRRVRRTGRGGHFFDRLYLRLPKIGDLVEKIAIARFSRTFGTLLVAGVEILEALAITREVVGNRVIRDALKVVGDRVRDGDTVAGPLERSGVFPDMVCSMVEVGEETGEMSQMLNLIADSYDEDVENAVGAMTSIIEPIMIVVLAILIGGIVIALFLPIINIIQQLSG
jgi:type IV pilus assembly protein PilC